MPGFPGNPGYLISCRVSSWNAGRKCWRVSKCRNARLPKCRNARFPVEWRLSMWNPGYPCGMPGYPNAWNPGYPVGMPGYIQECQVVSQGRCWDQWLSVYNGGNYWNNSGGNMQNDWYQQQMQAQVALAANTSFIHEISRERSGSKGQIRHFINNTNLPLVITIKLPKSLPVPQHRHEYRNEL